MDHLELFKQYAALVQQMRQAQDKHSKHISEGYRDDWLLLEPMLLLKKAVDTFPLPWERKEKGSDA